jgi:hypothetical protein
MPEDFCSREVTDGSLWTGEIFGLFIIEGAHNSKPVNQPFKVIDGGLKFE